MFLNKQQVLNKLSPLGVNSLAEIGRLIRKQGLPAKYFSAHKVFFVEAEIDTWMAARSVACTHTAETKIIKNQRKRGRKEKSIEVKAEEELRAEIKSFNKAQA
jgi:hypothetical protein